MIVELRFDEFGGIVGVLKKLGGCDAGWAIGVLGESDARVFVCDGERVKSVIVVARYGVGFLNGEVDGGVVRELVEAEGGGMNYLSLASDEMKGVVEAEYGDEFVGVRRVEFGFEDYELENARAIEERRGRDEIVVRKIRLDVVGQVGGVDGDFLIYWPDGEAFVENNVGYCLMCGDEMVSVAWSVYRPGRTVEIGVATKDGHWGCGYSTMAGARLVRWCVENGVEPHWSCDERNEASKAVAKKLGFVERGRYWWMMRRG